MKRFEGAERVGLRDIETNKLIAVYPHKAEGDDNEIENKVRDWYYQQNCGAEDALRNYYVDRVSAAELKSYQ